MHDENALTTPRCTLSNSMPTTNSHIHINANSPMLRRGTVPNANRGHYGGKREGRRRRPRREVEEEKRVGGARKDASRAMSGGKH